MRQLPLLDLTFLESPNPDQPDVRAARQALKENSFDVRQRSYESFQTFLQRQMMSAYALDIDYYNDKKWCSIKEWVEIAPKGEGNRLPSQRKDFPLGECYYLEIKDIQPSDWQTPHQLRNWNALDLPARATYILQPKDVLLSRFKEPPGKSIIFLDVSCQPIYVSSNFVPLRTKPDYSAFVLLAFLKSSFGLCQLNQVIRYKTIAAEMNIQNIPQIAVPQLSHESQQALHTYSQQIIAAEQVYRKFSNSPSQSTDIYETYANALKVLNEVSISIDQTIKERLEQQN